MCHSPGYLLFLLLQVAAIIALVVGLIGVGQNLRSHVHSRRHHGNDAPSFAQSPLNHQEG